jgi:tRNA-specific 2-thiouridylase
MSKFAVNKSTKPRPKVFVGLSGGVDSAVSAAILIDRGYDVTGVFIKVWQPDWIECTWKEDRRDAMRVAAKLGIPFMTLDFEEEYKKSVIDYMISEYAHGRTPNPDVMCNQHVKFGAFYNWAMARGGDFVATGHYAQVVEGKSGPELHAGIDKNKDQSYFLWTLTQDQLSHVIFPVGGLEKPQVRKLAEKYKLPNAKKKDSQGLCFVGKMDVKDFLSKIIPNKPGDVLDEKGKVIGSHPGSLFFTLGERHGFTISDKSPNDRPLYVISKDTEANTITVSSRLHDGALSSARIEVKIADTNWIGSPLGDLSARTRYRQTLSKVKDLSSEGDTATVTFISAHEYPTPGQSLVVYGGTRCFGGGIIQ